MEATILQTEYAPMVFAAQVETRESVVNLGALADVSALPAGLRDKVIALPVLKIPQGLGQISVSTAQLQARVKALVPGLKPWVTGPDHPVVIRYVRPEPPALGAVSCVQVREALPVDTTPTPRSFIPASCAGVVANALWFDAKAGVVRTTRALRSGDILQAPVASVLAGVAPGDPLVIEASVGPARVQRRVIALQAARPGEGLFAKAADGSVISVPYPSQSQ